MVDLVVSGPGSTSVLAYAQDGPITDAGIVTSSHLALSVIRLGLLQLCVVWFELN